MELTKKRAGVFEVYDEKAPLIDGVARKEAVLGCLNMAKTACADILREIADMPAEIPASPLSHKAQTPKRKFKPRTVTIEKQGFGFTASVVIYVYFREEAKR